MNILTEISLGFNKKITLSEGEKQNLFLRFVRAKKEVFLYGYKDEIDVYRELNSAIENPNSPGNDLSDIFNRALSTFLVNIRYEYDYPLSYQDKNKILKRRA